MIQTNTPKRAPDADREHLRQHLTSASDQLYSASMEYAQAGMEMPAELKRAWRAIRAERLRLESELNADLPEENQTDGTTELPAAGA